MKLRVEVSGAERVVVFEQQVPSGELSAAIEVARQATNAHLSALLASPKA
mgnify:CR=1 FL=1